MTATSNGAPTLVAPAVKKNRKWIDFKKYWMLHTMMVLPMIYYILFICFMYEYFINKINFMFDIPKCGAEVFCA